MADNARTNTGLQQFYDGVYKKGEKSHYTQLRLDPSSLPEEYMTVRGLLDWSGKYVLDVGCGTGMMCAIIADAGAKSVLGIDYAESAIAEANASHRHPALRYECRDVQTVTGTFDVIMSFGTLEHMDDPFATLKTLKGMLKPGGSLILTCPNWANPRGYVLQTLFHLFRAPITLADIHYFTPMVFVDWAEKLGMDLDWQTVEFAWGNKEKMLKDFERRLPNVARDAGFSTTKEQIEGFLEWLKTKALPLQEQTKWNGAVGVYHLKLRS
jgi:2-polyprenyl-3-methyl-5-hydroxy-6-metoxy-1,4-benzoquinol methylase